MLIWYAAATYVAPNFVSGITENDFCVSVVLSVAAG
jgi:hypothetical protein